MTSKTARKLMWKLTLASFVIVELIGVLVIAIILLDHSPSEKPPVFIILFGYAGFLLMSFVVFLFSRMIKRWTDDVYG